MAPVNAISPPRQKSVRRRVHEVLDGSVPGDRLGRVVDVLLIVLIIANVMAIVLESVSSIGVPNQALFHGFEVFSVIAFTFEYVLRIWSSIESEADVTKHPIGWRIRYALRPMALVDLIAILPFYITLFVPIADLRFLRAVRMLRVLKLTRYSPAAGILVSVLREEAPHFLAAFFLLLIIMIFASCGIYLVEHDAQPVAFGSIPAAMWWAVAALTTVGYGDVTPITPLGKVFGAAVTMVGIGMVALPSGILASGFSNHLHRRQRTYREQAEVALRDGVLDDREIAELDDLRQELGFSHEEAAEILHQEAERVRRPLAADPDDVSP